MTRSQRSHAWVLALLSALPWWVLGAEPVVMVRTLDGFAEARDLSAWTIKSGGGVDCTARLAAGVAGAEGGVLAAQVSMPPRAAKGPRWFQMSRALTRPIKAGGIAPDNLGHGAPSGPGPLIKRRCHGANMIVEPAKGYQRARRNGLDTPAPGELAQTISERPGKTSGAGGNQQYAQRAQLSPPGGIGLAVVPARLKDRDGTAQDDNRMGNGAIEPSRVAGNGVDRQRDKENDQNACAVQIGRQPRNHHGARMERASRPVNASLS